MDFDLEKHLNSFQSLNHYYESAHFSPKHTVQPTAFDFVEGDSELVLGFDSE